jgi:hypothetical protein
VEYVHALIDDMLTCAHLFILDIRYLGYELFLANPKQAALFYDKSMSGKDIYTILLYFKFSLIIYNIDRRTLHISTAGLIDCINT